MKVSDQASQPGQGRNDPIGGTVQFPRLLRVGEVAEILRTSRKAVYSMMARGEVPGVIRVNRRVLVDGAILISWIRQRTAGSERTDRP